MACGMTFEWHNYAACNICRRTQRNKFNLKVACNTAHLDKTEHEYPRYGERRGWNGNCDSAAQMKLTSAHVNTCK